MKKGYIQIHLSDCVISNKALQIYFESSMVFYYKDNRFYCSISKDSDIFYIGTDYVDIENFLLDFE